MKPVIRGAAALAAFLVMAAPACAAERLVMAPYPAATPWKTATDVRDGVKHLREQIPADQSIDAYHDILTDQAFPEQKGKDPSAFLMGLFSRLNGACDGVRVNGPKAAVEDGYPVAYGQAYCGQQKGKPFGVNMMCKVISGDDALYVIQREIHVPPSATGGVLRYDKDHAADAVALMGAQGEADAYLAKSVWVCGSRAKDERCR